jgi:drug/metabolite transporter (DMT)-like permease
MFLVLILEILFSLSFIVLKKTIPYGPPFFLVGVRMVISGILLLLYQFFYDRKSFSLLKNNWKLIGIASLLNVYVTNAYELWGMQYITAAKASLIYSFSPFASALLAYLFLSEKMNFKKWIGLFIGVVGLIPILLTKTLAENKIAHFGFLSLAELALLFAAIATAYGWVSIKQLVYQKGYPIILANGISMFLGGAISLGHSSITESWPNIFSISYLPFWGYTLLATLISSIICYNLYALLLSRYSATFMCFSSFILPFFTALFGWFFLQEIVSWQFYLSATIVFLGLYVFYLEE